MYPVFSHAWICDTDQPTVIVHSGVTDYGVRLDVYEGDECWVSGDGDLGDGNVDLLEALRFALDTWLPGTSGVALNSDGKIEVTYSGTATIRWGHEDTTLDPNVFGFLAEDVAISSTPSEAPYQSPLIWTPDRWATRDTGDVPDMIAANRVTGNGLARGYRMTTGFKRAIDFDLLPLTKVQLDDPERPFSTFYRVVQDWAEGRKIRVYDDQDDMPSGVFARIDGPRFDARTTGHGCETLLDPDHAPQRHDTARCHARAALRYAWVRYVLRCGRIRCCTGVRLRIEREHLVLG